MRMLKQGIARILLGLGMIFLALASMVDKEFVISYMATKRW